MELFKSRVGKTFPFALDKVGEEIRTQANAKSWRDAKETF